jgi:hypothetical protein
MERRWTGNDLLLNSAQLDFVIGHELGHVRARKGEAWSQEAPDLRDRVRDPCGNVLLPASSFKSIPSSSRHLHHIRTDSCVLLSLASF